MTSRFLPRPLPALASPRSAPSHPTGPQSPLQQARSAVRDRAPGREHGRRAMELCFAGACAPALLRGRRARPALSRAAHRPAGHRAAAMCAREPRRAGGLLRAPEAVAALVVAGAALVLDAVRGAGGRDARARLSARAAEITRARALAGRLHAAAAQEAFLVDALDTERERSADAARFLAAATARADNAQQAATAARDAAAAQRAAAQQAQAEVSALQSSREQHEQEANELRAAVREDDAAIAAVAADTDAISKRFDERMAELAARRAELERVAGTQGADEDGAEAARTTVARNEGEIEVALAAAEAARSTETEVSKEIEARDREIAERQRDVEKVQATLDGYEERLAQLKEKIAAAMLRDAPPPVPGPDPAQSETELKRLKREMRAGKALAKTLVESARDVVRRAESGEPGDNEQAARKVAKKLGRAERRMRAEQQTAALEDKEKRDMAVEEVLELAEEEGAPVIEGGALEGMGMIGSAVGLDDENVDSVKGLEEEMLMREVISEESDLFADSGSGAGVTLDAAELAEMGSSVEEVEPLSDTILGFSETDDPAKQVEFTRQSRTRRTKRGSTRKEGSMSPFGARFIAPDASEGPVGERFSSRELVQEDKEFLLDAERIRSEDLQLEPVDAVEASDVEQVGLADENALEKKEQEAVELEKIGMDDLKSNDAVAVDELITDAVQANIVVEKVPENGGAEAMAVEDTAAEVKTAEIMGSERAESLIRDGDMAEAKLAEAKREDAEVKSKKRRRGRPRKTVVESTVAAAGETTTPRRGRGRPRKTTAADGTESAKKMASTKNSSASAAGEERPKRKRGRPRKTETVE